MQIYLIIYQVIVILSPMLCGRSCINCTLMQLRAVGAVAVLGGMLQIIVFMFLCGITAMVKLLRF